MEFHCSQKHERTLLDHVKRLLEKITILKASGRKKGTQVSFMKLPYRPSVIESSCKKIFAFLHKFFRLRKKYPDAGNQMDTF